RGRCGLPETAEQALGHCDTGWSVPARLGRSYLTAAWVAKTLGTRRLLGQDAARAAARSMMVPPPARWRPGDPAPSSLRLPPRWALRVVCPRSEEDGDDARRRDVHQPECALRGLAVPPRGPAGGPTGPRGRPGPRLLVCQRDGIGRLRRAFRGRRLRRARL